jgi:hypothetical protein
VSSVRCCSFRVCGCDGRAPFATCFFSSASNEIFWQALPELSQPAKSCTRACGEVGEALAWHNETRHTRLANAHAAATDLCTSNRVSSPSFARRERLGSVFAAGALTRPRLLATEPELEETQDGEKRQQGTPPALRKLPAQQQAKQQHDELRATSAATSDV